MQKGYELKIRKILRKAREMFIAETIKKGRRYKPLDETAALSKGTGWQR